MQPDPWVEWLLRGERGKVVQAIALGLVCWAMLWAIVAIAPRPWLAWLFLPH